LPISFHLFFPRPSLPPSSPLFPYTTLFRSVRFRRACPPLPSKRWHSGSGAGWFRILNGWHHLLRSRHHLLNVLGRPPEDPKPMRSEEHTSELQSRENLVCRLLLEKKTTAKL